ncbi:MAG: hypothetical protein WCW64_00425 [Phycisphaerae bacterium]|jgi:hypothetical protein
MESVCCSHEVYIGFNPEGYRIDKTSLPMNRYTKWQVVSGKRWFNPVAVCFDSLPKNGWIKVDKFNWDNINMNRELSLI